MGISQFDFYYIAAGKVIFFTTGDATYQAAIVEFHPVAFAISGGDRALLDVAQLLVKLVIGLVKVICHMQFFILEPFEIQHGIAVTDLCK